MQDYHKANIKYKVFRVHTLDGKELTINQYLDRKYNRNNKK